MATWVYKKWAASKTDDLILTFEIIPNAFMAWAFGDRPRFVHFIGSGTVWYTYPHFKRCNSAMEGWLANYGARAEYERHT